MTPSEIAKGLSIPCIKCKEVFTRTESQVKRSKRSCADCERLYFAERRERRKAAGLPVSGGRSSLEYRKSYTADYRRKPEVKAKTMARSQVMIALRTGKLVKQPCQVCGDATAQAHHEDYEKPLDVWWLCQRHHADRHRELGTPLIRRVRAIIEQESRGE